MSKWGEIEKRDRAVINMDFDKTLTTGEGAPHWEDDDEEFPNDEMINWSNKQYRRGHLIVIWTARGWEQAGNVAGYLARWGVRYHGIRCAKGAADIYVDDKAVNTAQVVGDGSIEFGMGDRIEDQMDRLEERIDPEDLIDGQVPADRIDMDDLRGDRMAGGR